MRAEEVAFRPQGRPRRGANVDQVQPCGLGFLPLVICLWKAEAPARRASSAAA